MKKTLNKFMIIAMKFLSSGREDVDVRNIYSGRPFAVELINPKITCITNDMLSRLMSTINDSSTQVQITSNLKILTRSETMFDHFRFSPLILIHFTGSIYRNLKKGKI